MNKDKTTRNQHYVPRFYLERFIDDGGSLHIYDTKNKKFYKQKPENACYQKFLYEVEWHGTKRVSEKYLLPNHIEKIFSRYENEFAPFLRKMDQVCCLDQNPRAFICSANEKVLLIKLVTNFLLRTPKMMEAYSMDEIPDEVGRSDWMQSLREALELMGIGGADDYVKMAYKKVYLTDELGGGLAYDLYERIRSLNFTFFRAKNDIFLTSDQPAIMGNDKTILEEDNRCLYFALSPRVAVLFGNYGNTRHMNNRMIIIEDDVVDEFNMQMLTAISEIKGKIIGNSEKNVMKYIGLL